MGGNEEAGLFELGEAAYGSIRDGEGIFGVGAAEELVKHGKTPAILAGLKEDVLQVHYFCHEMAVAVQNIVVEVDGNGDDVEPGQLAFFRRHGQAEVGEGHAKPYRLQKR